jgi:hypothetical protein
MIVEVVMRQLAAILAVGTLVAAPAFAAGKAPATSRDRGRAPEAAALAPLAPLAPQDAQTAPQVEFLAPVSSATGPIPVGSESDIYCSGWIGETRELFAGAIISAEMVDSQSSFIEGDIVYLDLGTSRGGDAGQEFWIVRPADLVYRNDADLNPYGRLYTTPGRLRILCAQEESSIAEVVASCFDVQVGDRILPFEPVPVPLVRRTRMLTSCDPPSDRLNGRILWVRDTATAVAFDSVVFVDLGEENGLAPGDFLTVYRPRTDLKDLRTVLGEVAILRTGKRASLAKVTSMHEFMQRGDLVELK